MKLVTNKNNRINLNKQRDDIQNVIDLSYRVINLVLTVLLCGGLSSRNAVPHGVGDSTSEIPGRHVGLPSGCFVSRI